MTAIPMQVNSNNIGISAQVSAGTTIVTASLGTVCNLNRIDKYDGPISVTPSDTEQVLQTAGLMLEQNITIAPVPAGYGKITWNGSTLTVS